MRLDFTSQGVRGVVLDVEGTTTPITFVHEVLFSYARSHVKSYLASHLDSPELLTDLVKLRDEHALDVKQGLEPPVLLSGSQDSEIGAFVSYIHWLIDRDRKSPGLKSLQGKIWKQGYLDGTLKAPLYPDVLPALKRWQQAGLRIAIFSSGSVLAQKLLFAHTDAGDVTECISDYFDTTVGPKTETESYRRIAAGMGLPVETILFISDVITELNAAGTAGFQTLLCVRPGNQLQVAEGHETIHSFDEILLSA